ncbi:MAG: hypothetical protein OEX07_06040 [Gammaproteobacteria bacterium]|nr:hypothetical protein [Gammaproteobacteria bacterium]
MKNITNTLSLFLVFPLLLSCAGVSGKKVSHESVPQAHQWSEREVTILKSLSLNDFIPTKDETNRVVNNPDAARLGKKLFFEKRFSADGTVSCSSCHNPEFYFTDGLAQAVGLFKTTRNAPTIVGASNDIWFFRDGRVDSLWSQALHPIENPLEHRSSRSQFAKVIFNDPDLKVDYEKVFGPMVDISNSTRFPENAGPIQIKQMRKNWQSMAATDQKIITDIFVNGGKAIAAYETLLQPSPSRFDKYVKAVDKGDVAKMKEHLTKNEVAGLKIFIDKGKCFICHNGPMFSDQGFHNIGTPPLNVKKYDYGRSKAVRRVKSNPFNCLSEYNDAKNKNCDELEYMVFHDEDTLAAFKTPGLRNVTKTGPYMHAGQYKTLADVIKHYNKPPPTKVGMNKLLDIDLNDLEMQQLEAFLTSLDSPVLDASVIK